jgi:hypothetical protein
MTPADVVGMSVDEMTFMMRVAMEIEDPIVEYSHQNGEGFRVLLPRLARFMGKNQTEAATARAHGRPWCESPWCAEERRHGNAFAKAIEQLTGTVPSRANPNQPRVVTADEDQALEHLVSRQAAEWSSSSTYVVMAAHASGALRMLLENLVNDEIKHLCVLSAADRYLRGPRPWKRLSELVRVGLRNYRDQRARRSDGARIGSHYVTAIEVVLAHLLVERHVRRWLATVPLCVLAHVFESEPSDSTPDAACDDAEGQGRLAQSRARRAALTRWAPKARARAAAARRADAAIGREAAMVARITFANFAGAETPESPAARTLERRIRRMASRPMRRWLLAALREYQIRENRHARETQVQ